MTTALFRESVEVFFDGDCPLCSREIHFLRQRDRDARIRFTDISAADFRPEDYGQTLTEFMSEIRGRLPDGTWIRGVEVFRRLYEAVGFRWAVAVTRFPIVKQLLNLGYWLFARNRLRLTGRCSETTCAVK